MKTRATVVAVVAVLTLAVSCSRQQAYSVTATENGFAPSSLTVAKGQPAAITFTRTSDATCARDVVFPELGIKKPLPLDTPVVVSLPTSETKTYAFECGMSMYKGTVVVQ